MCGFHIIQKFTDKKSIKYLLITDVDVSDGGLLVQGVQGKVLIIAGGGLPVPDGGGDFGELLEMEKIYNKYDEL